MTKINIVQVRSRIGSSDRQKKTLDALGLRKMNNPVIKEATPQVRGMVRKVAHLITIEEI